MPTPPISSFTGGVATGLPRSRARRRNGARGRVGAEVVADRGGVAEVGDRVDDRVVDRPRAGPCRRPVRGRFEDRRAVAAFEGGPLGVGQALDEGGPAQRPLVAAAARRSTSNSCSLKVALGLEEGGGAGELADREAGHGLGLVRRPHRLVALARVEVGAVVGAGRSAPPPPSRRRSAARRRDRSRSEVACGPLSAKSGDIRRRGRRRAWAPGAQAPGTAASDSQR